MIVYLYYHLFVSVAHPLDGLLHPDAGIEQKSAECVPEIMGTNIE